MTKTDLDALRAFRDKVLKQFGAGKAFIKWYYREGKKGAAWLNQNPGWKPVVRLALIIPVSISKITAASKWTHKIAVILLFIGCIGFAVSAGKHEEWTRRKTALTGIILAFVTVFVYTIFMTPETAYAADWPTSYESGSDCTGEDETCGTYFFYEDHIGRPVLLSEYEDYDGDGSYFSNDGSNPLWQAVYDPFGLVNDDDDFYSTGIEVGNPAENGTVWSVPFRFPGQYQDPELDDDSNDVWTLTYNHHRYYMPAVGRYNRADPIGEAVGGSDVDYETNHLYAYVENEPIDSIDPTGLYGGGTHFNKTRKWAKCKKLRVAFSNFWVDINPRTSPIFRKKYIIAGKERQSVCNYHFVDTNTAMRRVEDALKTCKAGKFGRELHVLQDSYAHTAKGASCKKGHRRGVEHDKYNPENDILDLGMFIVVQYYLDKFADRCCCEVE